MYKDEIISEVWANREAYVIKHSHDIASMIKELMKRQKISTRPLIDRRLKPNKKIQSDSQEARS
jgi:hypothetical protein